MDFKRYVREHLPPLAIAREPEIVDELALHLADLYREARAAGLEHDAALARATAALPPRDDAFARELETASRALPGLIVDRWRAADRPPETAGSAKSSMLGDLRRDLRYALRVLSRAPGFTLVVVATLALGIGANAVIFSAIDAVLLRRAAVADPDTVVSIYTGSSTGTDPFSSSAYPDFTDLRAAGALRDVAAFTAISVVLDRGGTSESVAGELVSGNYFDLLGVRPAQGRGFLPDEDRVGAPVRVVVISDAMWRNRLGASPGAVGGTIDLNGHPYTVVGVAPREFFGPILGRQPELWAPMALQQELRPPSAGVRRSLGTSNLLSVRGSRWLNLIGRLSDPGALESARASADVLAANLEREYADSNRGRRFTIVPLGEGPGVRTSARPMLRLLAVAVTLVLLIACANVAGLLLVRAVSRRREVAVRMAVGAGRGRLVRQWFTESVVLALLGSIGGLVIAWAGTPLLYPIGLPATVPVGVDARILLFTLVVALGSGLLFGLAPVLQTFRTDTVVALRDEGGAVAGGGAAARLRGLFVILQVALSLVLLVGAGLFLRTLRNATTVDLGYDVDQVLLADLNLDVRGYAQDAGQVAYAQVLEKLNAIPGVAAAGAARVTVLSGAARTLAVSTDGRPVERDNSNALNVRANVITERYLDALGIRVTRGRNFLPSDRSGAPRVAIVSESLAARLHPGVDPVGRSIMLGDDPLAIVGVVPDTVYRSTTERNPPPFIYAPLAQNYESGMTLHVRTAGDPRGQIAALRGALRDVDPQLVLDRPRLLREEFDRSLGDQRLMAVLVGMFGIVALVLAAIGLYGVMSHVAGQRRIEIGIRMALGAEPASILRLMLTDGLRLVAIGAAIGLAGAIAGAKYVENQLFDVTPTDPLTFAAVCGTLFVVAAAACIVPARRAMRVDPSLALRAS